MLNTRVLSKPLFKKTAVNKTTVTLTTGILCLGLLGGCRGIEEDRPELGTVSGWVTMDNQPVPQVLVSFTPEGGRGSVGVTDELGRYELIYLHNVPGATFGPHKVTITTYYADDSSPEALQSKEKIPAKYNTKTTLSAEVAPGENLINFELTAK